MKLADLSAETIEKIKLVRWDRIIEKHEGPEDWESVLRYEEPEFLEVEGYAILLPVVDTPQPKGMRILGSTSPLNLDPLRYLN